MLNVTSNFQLKIIMVKQYTRDQVLHQLLVDDFGHSEVDSCGNEVKGMYTYLGSEVVDPNSMAALRSAVTTDTLACS